MFLTLRRLPSLGKTTPLLFTQRAASEFHLQLHCQTSTVRRTITATTRMSATNRALWQDKAGVKGVIREGPVPSELEDRKLLIKVHAWAMNPCDAMLQDQPLPFIKYPIILGQDVAGVVEAVGSIAASKFKVGDRVFGFSLNNGFQEHVILDHTVTAKIPDSIPYRDVTVFPLCISTCSFSLFGKDYLALPLPSLNPTSTGKSVLIWGGSSACGSNGIQLAKAAGFEVVTTCSAGSFDYVKSIGADKVFDRNSPTVADDVAAELDKGTCAGIYMAAGKVAEACQVAYKSKQKLFVASSNPVNPEDVPEGVEAKMTFGTGGIEAFSETLPVTFGGFLPEALAKGKYKIAPPPQVVSKKGLDGIQEALDLLKKGISSKKLVVEVEEV
ncbi:GroES-like protein [Biscogniauxia marginata]|nr:GroES-like protein [Biscogniauxia marginata]